VATPSHLVKRKKTKRINWIVKKRRFFFSVAESRPLNYC
jgi:hypothetical protein